jgi:hypothetical protein
MVVQPDNSGNLMLRISSDPILVKNIFSRLKDPQYTIPSNIEERLKKFGGIHSSEKGVLVSKVTTPDDYQTQIQILSIIQHYLDQVHDITTDLYMIHNKWMKLHTDAHKVILLTYFDELNLLKDGVRKAVMSVALQPVQEGIDKLQYLIDRGESTYKHLMNTNWNVKEGVGIIKEYLSLLKYGTTIPDLGV